MNSEQRPELPLWRRNPVLRTLCSVWFAAGLMFLMLLYASIVSALPQVRGAIEVTEMQAFEHWLFAGLVLLFTAALVAVSLLRIRWTLANLGVLTVHAGMFLLIVGAYWYFDAKIEGDVLLQSPRIELRSAEGRPLGKPIYPQKGEKIAQHMPAFGGHVEVEVLETTGGREAPITAAKVAVRIGSDEQQVVELRVPDATSAKVGRLQVALVTFPPESHFYDREAAAFYYRRLGEKKLREVPIEHLPIHRERYLDRGYVLTDREGRPVPSKRTRPEITLAGLRIPTGWFEPWRMPIALDTPGLPFEVEITGYVPYIAGMRTAVRAGGPRLRPAVELKLSAGSDKFSRWLLADSPSDALLSTVVPIEFKWVGSTDELESLLRPMAAPHELTIELRDPPLRKTVAIETGDVIELPEANYKLTIKQLSPSWPLMTPGFEGARTPMASVDVVTPDKSYNRTVLQRFPELSQDIDEQGKRHREGPYDDNLKLYYRSADPGWGLLVAGPDVPLTLALLDPDGTVRRYPLEVGRAQPIRLAGFEVNFTVAELIEKAKLVSEPVIEPLEMRRPNIGVRRVSAIRLRLYDPQGTWSEERWMSFSGYPHVDQRPLVITGPRGDKWELIYSRRSHALGAELLAGRLSVKFFPGRRAVESWRSDFFVRADGRSPVPAAVYTNHTHYIGQWALFQSGAAPDHWSYTILGVGNRHGVWPMTLGCVLVTLGCLYAFYVKPVVKRRDQQRRRAARLAREAAGQAAGQSSPEPDLVEVR